LIKKLILQILHLQIFHSTVKKTASRGLLYIRSTFVSEINRVVDFTPPHAFDVHEKSYTELTGLKNEKFILEQKKKKTPKAISSPVLLIFGRREKEARVTVLSRSIKISNKNWTAKNSSNKY